MAKKPYVLLYGVGGGVRALLPLAVLKQIREMRDSHFIHGVDCLGGPSTAAIYLSGFNRLDPDNPTEPLRSEAEMVEMYKEASPQIFDLHSVRRHFIGRNKYDPRVLESFLHQLMGETTFSEGLKSQIVPAKTFKGAGFRFTSLKEAPEHNHGGNVPAYQVSMASATHPGCFPTYPLEVEGKLHRFEDGGLFDNPYYTYRYLKRSLPADTDIHMIVLSTGVEPDHLLNADQFDKTPLSKMFGLRSGMPLAQEKTNGDFNEGMHHLRRELGTNLIELDYDLQSMFGRKKNKPVSVPILDDATPEVLKLYDEAAARLIESKADTIRQIADLLTYRETWDLNADYRRSLEIFPEAPPPEVRRGLWNLNLARILGGHPPAQNTGESLPTPDQTVH